MPPTLGERFCAAFAPPRYLAPPLSGIEISTSSVKAVRLEERLRGLILANYAMERLPAGAFANGEVVNNAAVAAALSAVADKTQISAATVALPESKSFLFEAIVPGKSLSEWRIGVEQDLDELVPIPPSETVFDIVEAGCAERGLTRVAGIGLAKRVVDNILAPFDQAGVEVRVLEGETFAIARSLLPFGDTSTTLIIDVGRTTTKIVVVAQCIPRFSATIGIGGHSFTLAVQKHFGVTESEARVVKMEHGIISSAGNEDYLAAMLSTASAIRDEISRRLEYWQGKASFEKAREPVSRAILVGGNASIRGLPEYFESTLHVPVVTGDVFTNFAPRNMWVPPLEYVESLAFETSIGLALYDHTKPYDR